LQICLPCVNIIGLKKINTLEVIILNEMTGIQIILSVIQMILAITLIIVILFQSSKSSKVSGSIMGGAETFFGKNKGRTIDTILTRWTGVIAIVFVALTITINVLLNR